ncbi:MAG: hypothetical protein AAGI69_08980 [Cyanobacteria bacterium P01_H01_bin.21]
MILLALGFEPWAGQLLGGIALPRQVQESSRWSTTALAQKPLRSINNLCRF